jgi:branched-chain amino acid transport system permease protein
MSISPKKLGLYGFLLLLSLVIPYLLPALQVQLAYLWLMVIFAMTWDIVGGQMGYNSFGNIFYFGVGMYITAVVQRDLYYDVDEYAEIAGTIDMLNNEQYLTGLFLGLGVSGIVAVLLAIVLGSAIMGLRGHYFAICTLGLGIAAGEIAGGIDYVGAGSGLVTPVFPSGLGEKGIFFYYLYFVLAVVTFLVLRKIYSGRFGLAINAIRDDEDKAEAMGLHTVRYKTTAWSVAAFFVAIAGGITGNFIGFIDPIDTAFAGSTFGVWMVLMAILGGKGTLWGPVVGAVMFHIAKELLWTYLFGLQWVALGALIVIIVVFFPQGMMGYIRARRPEWLGHKVDKNMTIDANEESAK